jgi:thymidine phosphorylase
VLDVKTGNGAFMKSLDDAMALAETMVELGRGMGKKVAALITDMEQPLGNAVGNALEVAECLETLKGRGPKDLESLSLELAAWMLHLVGTTATLDAARSRARDALLSGAGLRKFREVVEKQGGDPSIVDDPQLLPRAREVLAVRAEKDGRVVSIGCRAVGQAAMLLGAGRETVDSVVDPAVGLVLHKKVGDLVIAGEPYVTLHVNDRGRLEEALVLLKEAIRFGPEAPARARLIHHVIS